jgi:ABC-type uncharacterized transport system permease subunit
MTAHPQRTSRPKQARYAQGASGGASTAFILIAAGLFVAGVFGMRRGDATFRLSRPTRYLGPCRTSSSPRALQLHRRGGPRLLGARQFLRGGGRWTTMSLGSAWPSRDAAFLVWATAGKSFSLTGMLQATMVRAVPIALGGLAGVLCERVAVVNIAIEGMLLAGAFTGALMGSLLGGWGGLVRRGIGGMFGFILAALVVTYRMDQIIAGVVINLFVLGLTSLCLEPGLRRVPLSQQRAGFPLLEDPAPRRHSGDRPDAVQPEPLRLRRAGHGRRGDLLPVPHPLRAARPRVGEHPRAADTLGINVYRTRYINVTLGGMVAGFGGAWFTLGSVGRFDENMTGGRGFIGLAAMIFGRWHPSARCGGACLRLHRFAAAETRAVAHADPVGVPGHGALYRDDRRRRRFRRTLGPPAADGKPYVKE